MGARVTAMRGFASIVLLLAFCALFLAILSAEQSAWKASSDSVRMQLALEQSLYAELEFKEAVRSAISSAEGSSREEKTADAALKLASLEAEMEKSFGERGIRAGLWAGVTSDSELHRLKRTMLNTKTPLKCAVCFDFSAVSSGVLVTQGFLDASPAGKIAVSRTGSSFIPLLSAHSFSPKKFMLGASFYFPESNVSMIAVAEEGFS